MKKLTQLCFVALFAFLCTGSLLHAAAESKAGSAANDSATGAERDADSGIIPETDADANESGEIKSPDVNAGDEQEKKEFVSVRKKKKPFTFKMGFSAPHRTLSTTQTG